MLVWALIDLAKRPASLVTGGRKWPWLLVCLFFQLAGPLLYLVVGRQRPAKGAGIAAAAAAPPSTAPEGDQAVPAVTALFGSPRSTTSPEGAGSSPRPGAAIELTDLHKQLGATAALDGLTLTVPEGSVFGFLGPNGSGKTTTLRILAGLARPTAGEARLLGRTLPHAGSNAFIGYLPDVPAFYPWMTAEQYLHFTGHLFGLAGEALEERLASLLDLAGLDGVHTRIGGYSRGMRQRLGVAQALINAPRLLLLDEPTSALDPIGRREVLDMIASLRGRTTVFFSTHILGDVERVCDTVAIIAHGRVVEQAGIDGLRELRSRRGGLTRLVVEADDPGRLAEALRGRPWLRALVPSESGGLSLSVDDLAGRSASCQRSSRARASRCSASRVASWDSRRSSSTSSPRTAPALAEVTSRERLPRLPPEGAGRNRAHVAHLGAARLPALLRSHRASYHVLPAHSHRPARQPRRRTLDPGPPADGSGGLRGVPGQPR